MTTENPFPLKDRTGHGLGPDCFVRVERESRLGLAPEEFRGLVVSLHADRTGAYVRLREWVGGFTGRTREARPETCTVIRKPEALRLDQQATVQAVLRTRARKAVA